MVLSLGQCLLLIASIYVYIYPLDMAPKCVFQVLKLVTEFQESIKEFKSIRRLQQQAMKKLEEIVPDPFYHRDTISQ